MNPKFRSVLIALLLMTASAFAALKTWTSTETIQSADLNANFNTINTAANALITNAKVSNSADISQTKIHGLTAALLPKAWAIVKTATINPDGGQRLLCNPDGGATCFIDASNGVDSVVPTGGVTLGSYLVTWSTPRADSNYAVLASPYAASTVNCSSSTHTTTTAQINCRAPNAGVVIDSAIQVLMMDNL